MGSARETRGEESGKETHICMYDILMSSLYCFDTRIVQICNINMQDNEMAEEVFFPLHLKKPRNMERRIFFAIAY